MPGPAPHIFHQPQKQVSETIDYNLGHYSKSRNEWPTCVPTITYRLEKQTKSFTKVFTMILHRCLVHMNIFISYDENGVALKRQTVN